MKKFILSLSVAFLLLVLPNASYSDSPQTLLHVSFDPTREMLQDINVAFESFMRGKKNREVEIRMSHGGSGKQARAIIDGLEADVASLALAHDVDIISEKTGKIPANWATLLPNKSVPFTSTIVFLTRAGNPKNIHDWEDLARDDVKVVMPNPQTSGGARWVYLSMWGYGISKYSESEDAIKDYIKKVYSHVPVLDTAARGSTITFAQRGIGDVLVTWENEALLAADELGKDKFEVVYPSVSIVAEPVITVVQKVAEANNTTELANEYANFVFSPDAQRIVARNYFRPTNAEVAKEFSAKFKEVKTFRLEEYFGTWAEADAKHFAKGGVFDQIYSGK